MMFKLLMCLCGFHGVTEIDYTREHGEVHLCRECLKEVKSLKN